MKGKTHLEPFFEVIISPQALRPLAKKRFLTFEKYFVGLNLYYIPSVLGTREITDNTLDPRDIC